MKLIFRSAALLGLLGFVAASSAAPRARVSVFFLKGEQLVPVTRTGTSAADAVRELVAGPTSAERARGMRSYVPRGTVIRKLTVTSRLVIVDVTHRFTGGTRTDSLLARLAQLVRTVTAPRTRLPVQLLVDGRRVSGVFPGVPTAQPVTFQYLRTPSVPPPPAPRVEKTPVDPALRVVQRRLVDLGYLPAGSADGRNGPMTEEATIAFQKWERLPRTAVLDAKTKARLPTAVRPTPVTHPGTQRRLEVLLDRQVALLIDANRVVLAIAVSSGKPSTPTPPGRYRVYAKITRWWSVPFREWLPWAVPFVGGIAFHQYPNVPAYAASHGCVRQVPAVARMTYDFAGVGMPVTVIAHS